MINGNDKKRNTYKTKKYDNDHEERIRLILGLFFSVLMKIGKLCAFRNIQLLEVAYDLELDAKQNDVSSRIL